MKKLVQGILDFRTKVLPNYRETFAKLALGQSPDALFISCSDSRVAVNVFASTDPGDLFVVRNVGNMVPPSDASGRSVADESEAAAIEFALNQLKVAHIIICGHSECGAMQAIAGDRNKIQLPHLKQWLRHGEKALENCQKDPRVTPGLALHNQLSQLNVLMQLEHLKTYPLVQEALASGRLKLHGWWFELKQADVHVFDPQQSQFVLFDEAQARRLMS